METQTQDKTEILIVEHHCRYCGDTEVVARQESHLKGSKISHSPEDEYSYMCQNCMSAYIDGQMSSAAPIEDFPEDTSCEDNCTSYDECQCPTCDEWKKTCHECFKTAKCGKELPE